MTHKLHCPHQTGVSLASYPPQQEVICCHCGLIGWQSPMMGNIGGHGKFAPREITGTITKWPDNTEQYTE